MHYKRWKRSGDAGGPNPRGYVKVCIIDGCFRTDMNARGLCRMHYMRWFNTGSTGTGDPMKLPSGELCQIENCNEPNKGHRYCNKHYQRWAKHGDPLFTIDTSKENSPMWAGEEVGYFGLHDRLRRERGSARGEKCIDCGARAEHWSYDHLCGSERIDSTGLPYSTNLDHYDPRCIPCHNKFDNNQKLSQNAGASTISEEKNK